ncbi:thaumatin-like protein [Infundibulicybe gibba]|nr:thaumatin-like protein [Infundibulicybe gibba]
MKLTLTTSLALASSAAARTFTVYNACPYTIWPAMFTDLNVAPNKPNFATGWEAKASTKVTFHVPDNWKAGRIWGRRNCNFATNPGPNSCLTGGCNGGLLCDQHTGTGVPPATVAEWTLQGDGSKISMMVVSLVDGYNLPVKITNNKGCPVAQCNVDLGPNCPAPLKGPYDSKGFPSAAPALTDYRELSQLLLRPVQTPATCPSSGVQYYSYFKSNCPTSYAYAYDEGSHTALWTCDSNLKADYTLTFCP